MNRQPDMRQLMQQAQKLQEQMASAQAELAARTFEGTSGGGMVRATVTGTQELVEIKVSPEVVDPEDVEMLEDLIVAAVRSASEASIAAAGESLGGVTGGLDLGDLLG